MPTEYSNMQTKNSKMTNLRKRRQKVCEKMREIVRDLEQRFVDIEQGVV